MLKQLTSFEAANNQLKQLPEDFGSLQVRRGERGGGEEGKRIIVFRTSVTCIRNRWL